MNENDIIIDEIINYLNHIYVNTANAKERNDMLTYIIALTNIKNEYIKFSMFKTVLKQLINE